MARRQSVNFHQREDSGMILGSNEKTLKELFNLSSALNLKSEDIESLCEGELTALEYRLGKKVACSEVMLERLRAASGEPSVFSRIAESELCILRDDLEVVRRARARRG